jgi:hypothetical protein
LPCGEGVLAGQLQELLADALPLDFPYEDGFYEIGAVGDSDDSLWQPLLALAAQNIEYGAVAEALVIRAGKWAPETEIPDID